MADATVIAGLAIPSTSPLFLAGVAVHVAAGLTCAVCGALAMLSPKGRGRHSAFGTVYFWGLAVVCATAAVLAAGRWAEDAELFGLAVIAFGAALLGRAAIETKATRLHASPAWSTSYIVLPPRSIVDNGKH